MQKIVIYFFLTILIVSNSLSNDILKTKKGWNLVSLPKVENIDTLLSEDIKYLWEYDNINKNWLFNSGDQYIKDIVLNQAKFNPITYINDINGYWIYPAKDMNFTFPSNYEEDFNLSKLQDGWNLVSTNVDIKELTSISNAEFIFTYTDKQWHVHSRNISDFMMLTMQYNMKELFEIKKHTGFWIFYYATDTDKDGIADHYDIDDDNDGVDDKNDNFPLDSNETADADSDGIGDNADSDDDNDGVDDKNDTFPLNSSETADADSDGIGDNADSDDDNDGVDDKNDTFPLNSSETSDADSDGIGDNADSDDDNDGVDDINDFYPLQNSCSKEADGNGTKCYLSLVKDIDSKNIIFENDKFLFVDNNNDQLIRYDHKNKTFLDFIKIKTSTDLIDATFKNIIYSSSHNSLYLGYSNGLITKIDLNESILQEKSFTTLPLSVNGLSQAGNYILAQDSSGAWESHYTFDNNGILQDNKEWNHYSKYYDWDSINNRVYFFSDTSYPHDLHYEIIDQSNGKISNDVETPYHGDYTIKGPIFVSKDGDSILLGSGDIYNADDLTWKVSLPNDISAAIWTTDNELIYGYSEGVNSIIKRRNSDLLEIESISFEGKILKIVKSYDKYIILTNKNGLQFNEYIPSNDTDNDGILNENDEFPTDPSASIDKDSDKFPDSWNQGYTQEDSTTGLKFDYYPDNLDCNLLEHGDGVTCDISKTIPSYIPDMVKFDKNGTIYLVSNINKRIYRWDVTTKKYIDPLLLNDDVNVMDYSLSHNRLYLGYSSGAITRFDLNESIVKEKSFTTLPLSVDGLSSAGNYILAQDSSGAWNTHYIFDLNGVLQDSEDWNEYSKYYAWDEINNKVYFFDGYNYPDDLHYEKIDQETGQISNDGETPYYLDYSMKGPIFVSKDGDNILLGSGDIYNADDLTWKASLPNDITDAFWLNGELFTIRSFGSTTYLQKRDSTYSEIEVSKYKGSAYKLVEYNNNIFILTNDNGEIKFNQYKVDEIVD